jgi:DNA-binding CsgD family transcriptional regulator
LGEWPLCAECLELELDEFAPMPLPDYSNTVEEEPGNPNDTFRSNITAFADDLQFTNGYPFGLTRREFEIARLVNLSNQEIAERLSISLKTAKSHVTHIMEKLGVTSRQEIRSILYGQEMANGAYPWLSLIDQVDGPMTYTLTITVRVDQLEKILSALDKIRATQPAAAPVEKIGPGRE